MAILYDDGNKPYKHPVPYDKDEKIIYSRSYRPNTWKPTFEYVEEEDVVIPSTSHGFMHECVSGGISGLSQPSFIAQKGKFTVDGEVKWKARPYILLLRTGDSISTSTWIGTNGEVVDGEDIVDGIQTKFRLISVPVDATSARMINHISVTRANGDIEEFDRTMIITIKEL